MKILGIDAGTTKSGYMIVSTDVVKKDTPQPLAWGHVDNNIILDIISDFAKGSSKNKRIALEGVESYGMPIGKDTIKTIMYIGRFQQQSQIENVKYSTLNRSDIKLFLCNTKRANDKNVRQSIIDIYGGNNVAIGGKRCSTCKGKKWFKKRDNICLVCDNDGYEISKGLLHGVSGHVWSALAVCLLENELTNVNMATHFLKYSMKK